MTKKMSRADYKRGGMLVFVIMTLAISIGLSGCGTIMKAKTITLTSESGAEAEIRVTVSNPTMAATAAATASGAAAAAAAGYAVPDIDNIEVYVGKLPAKFKVTSSKNKAIDNVYTVHYTDKDGNPATMELKKSFTYWVLGNIPLTGGITIITDVIMGTLFSYNFANNKIPINYESNPEIEVWLFEGIPAQMQENLILLGNINDF
jgi:uncharacterized protein YceK